MSTSEEVDRWKHVLKQAVTPSAMAINIMRKARVDFATAQASVVMVGTITDPVLEHWRTAQPEEGSHLHAVIAPVINAVEELDPTDVRLRPVTDALDLIEVAQEQLDAGVTDSETADDVVREMVLDLKTLVVSARLAHVGVMNLIDGEWDTRATAINSGRSGESSLYVDVMTLESTNTESVTTVPFSELRASIDPGVATVQEYIEQGEFDTVVQSRFASQWVVTFVTEWELNYRPRLARIHGCAGRDIASELMRDLGFMRNDYVHKRGIASSKQGRCKRLKWFSKGDNMQPRHEHYQQLFEEFEREREAFTTKPKPVKTSKVELKAQVPQVVADRFSAIAGELGLTDGEALGAAVDAWCDAHE
ncbi:hypothetical protein [Gordonia phthalatica]|uniref:Uncharacterized protein n=1 Tax=Gordonia phthalatica TaxID=1136941 RepID=A0A0N9NFR9_9ACTN|nr:hypothetical protein [Gordonia phthalatica]ALG84507.1 hypothetical protein ACH46_08345 [Gordonia phthalatica]